MELPRFTYLILFSPGIVFGAWTAFKLWRALGKLEPPWRYRRRFLRIFLLMTGIAWLMDYLLIYFEAWRFPAETHLWNLPAWPKTTLYGNPMIIPFEEFFLFNTLITWFVAYLLIFQFTVANNVQLDIETKGAGTRTQFEMSWDGERVTGHSEPFWLVRLVRWLRRLFGRRT